MSTTRKRRWRLSTRLLEATALVSLLILPSLHFAHRPITSVPGSPNAAVGIQAAAAAPLAALEGPLCPLCWSAAQARTVLAHARSASELFSANASLRLVLGARRDLAAADVRTAQQPRAPPATS